jgi:hypothetical protein
LQAQEMKTGGAGVVMEKDLRSLGLMNFLKMHSWSDVHAIAMESL